MTQSKSERAYQWIRTRILSREFTPGYRLVLHSLASALGMSAVPVREAVRRLEAEGLVRFERNVGARVASVDPREYAQTMETLGIVEGAATALAAPLLTERHLQRAESLNQQMERLLDNFDPVDFTGLNRRFHSILFAPCPNDHILELVHRGWTRLSGLRGSTFAFVPDRALQSVQEHYDMLEMLRSDVDPVTIELAARNHRWRTKDALLRERSTGPAPLEPV